MKKEALIVGISDYKYISDLSYCDEDTMAWFTYLTSRGYKCTVLGDLHKEDYLQYDGVASEANVRSHLVRMLKTADEVVFASSGHGAGNGKGDSYLCLHAFDGVNDKYEDRELLTDLKRKRDKTKLFMFIDHCFSGGFLDEVKKVPNVVCMTTCTEKGYGFDCAITKSGKWTNKFLTKTLVPLGDQPQNVVDLFAKAKLGYGAKAANTPQMACTIYNRRFML
jgi:hypothetical protein